MLRVDHHTSIHSRGKFARICVELDLQRELVPSFTVFGREFKLEYEGLHLICFGCGKYGHRKEACTDVVHQNHPENSHNTDPPASSPAMNVGAVSATKTQAEIRVRVNENNATSSTQAQPSEDSRDPCFGPWMIAKKQGRRRTVSTKNQGGSNISGLNGSRFNSLMEEMAIDHDDVANDQVDPHTFEKHHNLAKKSQARTSTNTSSTSTAQRKGPKSTQPNPKILEKEKGKAHVRTPLPKSGKVTPSSDPNNFDKQIIVIDPEEKAERARREILMLKEMQRINRQYYSDPTNVVEMLYGSSSMRHTSVSTPSEEPPGAQSMSEIRPPDPKLGGVSTPIDSAPNGAYAVPAHSKGAMPPSSS